ncbi:MAG: nitroreductase family protein [Prevotellaceae bacterium]|nr:nitroreductase family protein [Prevotellaceae bacterium]
MSLEEILQHRRAVRKYDPEKNLDPEKVKDCIRLATLAPTSSNMQLWEAYHVTDPEVLKEMAVACLNQGSARSCKEMVVFVTRQDKWKSHAKAVLEANIAEINANSPEDRKAHRIALQKQYYAKLMPLTYKRCFGLLGLFRCLVAQIAGLFRPVPRQESEAQMNTVVHKSCALAVQTFMLAMSEQGYDTCPLEGFDSLRVKKVLHLPHDCGINMVITCGYRAPGGVRGERYRLPLDEFYHRI